MLIKCVGMRFISGQQLLSGDVLLCVCVCVCVVNLQAGSYQM